MEGQLVQFGQFIQVESCIYSPLSILPLLILFLVGCFKKKKHPIPQAPTPMGAGSRMSALSAANKMNTLNKTAEGGDKGAANKSKDISVDGGTTKTKEEKSALDIEVKTARQSSQDRPYHKPFSVRRTQNAGSTGCGVMDEGGYEECQDLTDEQLAKIAAAAPKD